MTYGESRTYKKVEVIGVSNKSVDDAIRGAVDKANDTLERLSWFEVAEIRGHINDGKIAEYQVTLRLAFQLK